jgi:hypothetical protein
LIREGLPVIESTVVPSAQIWVRELLPVFHVWPGAAEKLAYLANRHRHLFDVRAFVRVGHVDREIEFFALADQVRDWWGPGERECGGASCEAIAVELGNHLIDNGLAVTSVQIAIDGEGGAIVDWPQP